MSTDFTKPAAEIIIDLINENNPLAALPPGALLFSEPTQPQEGEFNSEVTVTGNPDAGYTGEAVVRYNRVYLSDVQGYLDYTIKKQGALTVADILPVLNARYGINLTESDIEPSVLGGIGNSAELITTPGSLIFLGDMYLEIVEDDYAELGMIWRSSPQPNIFPANDYGGLEIGIVGPIEPGDVFTIDVAWTPGSDGSLPPELFLEDQGDPVPYVSFSIVQNEDSTGLSSGSAILTLVKNGIPTEVKLYCVCSDNVGGDPLMESVGTYATPAEIPTITRLQGNDLIAVPAYDGYLSIAGKGAFGSPALPALDWSLAPTIAAGNGIFVAMGKSGTNEQNLISTSVDGETWVNQVTNINNINSEKLMFLNGFFIAYDGVSNYLQHSVDGIAWTMSEFLPIKPTSIAYGNGWYVGITTAQNGIVVSSDLITWTQRDTDWAFPMLDVTFGQNKFVFAWPNGYASAVLDGSGVPTYGAPTGWGGTVGTIANPRLAFGNDVFLVVQGTSSGGAAKFAFSAAGTSWALSGNPITGFTHWDELRFHGGFFTVTTGGTGIVGYSSNATAWGISSAELYASNRKIAYENALFVMIGITNIGAKVNTFISTDLQNWADGQTPAVMGAESTVTVGGEVYTFPGGINDYDPPNLLFTHPVVAGVDIEVEYDCGANSNIFLVDKTLIPAPLQA